MLLASKPGLARRVVLMVIALSIIAAAALVSQSWAHKVNVFARAEGDTVFVEGYYPGGKKAQNSLVEIFNPAGTKLLEGRTNNEGVFTFKVPENTDLRIVLTDSTGHRDDFIIYASSPTGVGSLTSAVVAEKHSHSVGESVSVSADIYQLETIIDEALDRKLDPVIEIIHDSRKQGPSVTEIIGGIGCIFGVFGLVMYFKNRRKGTRRKAQGARKNEEGGTNG